MLFSNHEVLIGEWRRAVDADLLSISVCAIQLGKYGRMTHPGYAEASVTGHEQRIFDKLRLESAQEERLDDAIHVAKDRATINATRLMRELLTPAEHTPAAKSPWWKFWR